MTKLTLSALKKELKALDQKELIQLIAELYKVSDDVKLYVSNRFMGEEAILALYETTKKKIRHEFFPERGMGKLRLKEVKNAIADFKKLAGDKVKTLDLMLYSVEMGTEYTLTFGDISEAFYNSMLSMFEKLVDACNEDEAIFKMFDDRLYRLVEETGDVGWGYHDCLNDLYFSIDWVWEEELNRSSNE